MKKPDCFDFVVIGAGPAGIATVGKLIDHGVLAKNIGWIDPYFRVGDMGEKWRNVPSNTQIAFFHKFLHESPAFGYQECHESFPIDSMDKTERCPLSLIADPLLWVTKRLARQVITFQDQALDLRLTGNVWEITTKNTLVVAKKVILAIGSEPKELPFLSASIPLAIALDQEKLAKQIKPGQSIGVFGSSHSAMLVLGNLMKHPVNVINFYRSAHRYALYLKDWILYDNTGLKGFAADWAKKNLDGVPPPNLRRVLLGDPSFEMSLKSCDQVVYAVGFTQRNMPVLKQFDITKYNARTGLIAPGLFGVGIAYPEAVFDPLWNMEYNVGLWKFINYLNKVMPIWLLS